LPLVLATIYMATVEYGHMMHPHEEHEGEPVYAHMRKRTNVYPWLCKDCDLFDGACWSACKKVLAEEAAAAKAAK